MIKIVSIILARGGSKGIPKKNIINLKGEPLIHYAIKASKKSQVHETWVSTDSKEIALISEQNGADVLFRPKYLATDTSTSEEALLHFTHTHAFDILVFIQPTSPLLTHQDINKGLDLILNASEKYDSVFSVYKEHWLPRWTLNIKPKEWDPVSRPRRQDKEELYVENGALYITKRDFLIKSQLRYSGKIGVIKMPISRSFQIDTTEDLQLVKKLL